MPERHFTVKLTPSFQKDLVALPRREQDKILAALAALERDPFGPSSKIKRLKGKGVGQLRLRVGVYRVRYDVIGRDVALYRVRHRKEIYRS